MFINEKFRLSKYPRESGNVVGTVLPLVLTAELTPQGGEHTRRYSNLTDMKETTPQGGDKITINEGKRSWSQPRIRGEYT